ncbi:MAG: bifunctional ornithine acetyltransferase/N-acetylglutamate synthase, partial [Sphingomicrobium sp.]
MSVTAPQGFVAAGLHAGVKARRPDFALLVTADGKPVPCAAVFTQNKFRAPPVEACVDRLAASGGMAVGVVVNS